jgi:hypothetical protein
MTWEIQLSEAFDYWFRELSDSAQEAIIAAVERLKELDDDLDSAPFVGRVKGAQRRPLRELGASGTGLVVPFTFDPKTCEIVLLAGREAS